MTLGRTFAGVVTVFAALLGLPTAAAPAFADYCDINPCTFIEREQDRRLSQLEDGMDDPGSVTTPPAPGITYCFRSMGKGPYEECKARQEESRQRKLAKMRKWAESIEDTRSVDAEPPATYAPQVSQQGSGYSAQESEAIAVQKAVQEANAEWQREQVAALLRLGAVGAIVCIGVLAIVALNRATKNKP